MEAPAFAKVFTALSLSEEDRSAFADATVEELEIHRNTRTMKVTLAVPRPIAPSLRARLRVALCGTFRLERAEVTLRTPKGSFGEEEAHELLSLVAKEYPSVFAFLRECGYSVREGELILSGITGGEEIVNASGVLRYMEKTARECYGTELRVSLRPAEEGEETRRVSDFERRRDEEMERLLHEAAQNAPKKSAPKPAPKKEFVHKRRPPAPSVKEEDILFGKPFGEEPTHISEMEQYGYYAVEGEIFFLESREVRNGEMLIVSFYLYDGTGSVCVKTVQETAKGQELLPKLRIGDRVAVRGEAQYDNFEKDTVLRPKDILRRTKILRMDNAPEKRVELHLHTKMSSMDGVVDPKKLVETALRWGHRAVAVTDHGVLHAYPDLFHAAEGKDIRILYGCEGYYVNNEDPMPAVFGGRDEPLDGDFVCFTLSRTGNEPGRHEILEIAAALLRDGRVIDTYQTYVRAEKPIPAQIAERTGINAGMLADAPPCGRAVADFLRFTAGRVLVSHTAETDLRFLRAAAEREGLTLPSDLTFADTLPLARVLLPAISRHDRLNLVLKELGLAKPKSVGAAETARATALAFAEFAKLIRAEKVQTLGGVNALLSERMERNAADKADAKSLPSYHILLLAKDMTGIKALNRLTSMGYLDYMNARKHPIIPRRELAKYREGLIIGSACEAGELFRAMVDGAEEEQLLHIAEFYDFLEIQPIGNNAFMLRDGTAADEEELRDYNRRILALGDRLGKPVVATGDVHFLEPGDEAFRRVIMDAKGFEDADQQAPLYFRTTEDMLAEFSYLGTERAYEVVVRNTNAIAELCNVECPFSKEYCPPEIPGSAEELETTVRSEAARQYGNPLPEQVSQVMEKELKSIISNGYDVMYVFAQKLIRRSNECGYMVGSRGSVGSSIVAYFLGITEVNALPPHYRCKKCAYSEFHQNEGFGCGQDMPEKLCPNCGVKMHKDGFDIPFETFLGFNGDKTPDIDLNFSNEYQSRAHQHTVEMFGKENVFRAGTIGTVAEKTAFGYVKKYCERRELTLSRAEMQRLAIGCTDIKRTTGQHPGGMVVVPHTHEIYDFCAVQHPADDPDTDIIITHVDYHSIDQNLLKFDILGHKDPTMIKHLEELTGMKMEDIDLNDPETLSLYSSSEALGIEDEEIFGSVGTCAVPEFGTHFVKQVLEDTLPSSIDDLVRVCGMTHGTDVWLNNAQEIIAAGYAPLSGCICCRDDIMLNLIQWGMPSKLSFDIMEKVRKGKGLKPEWEDEMRKHGVPEWYIDSCKKIKYMFPKAHAAAYVINGFRVAWFKLHRPLAFYCAFLSVRADALDAEVMLGGAQVIRAKILELRGKQDATQVEQELQKNLEVCYEFSLRGFTVLPVDIYESKAEDFTMVRETQLRLPFNAVPGLGGAAAENLYEEAQRAPFLSVEEVADRCKRVSSTLIEKLRVAGAFRDLPATSQISFF